MEQKTTEDRRVKAAVKGMHYTLKRELNISDSSWQDLPIGGMVTATGDDTETLADRNAIGSGHYFYDVESP